MAIPHSKQGHHLHGFIKMDIWFSIGMSITRVVMQDACPSGLPEMLPVALAVSSTGGESPRACLTVYNHPEVDSFWVI